MKSLNYFLTEITNISTQTSQKAFVYSDLQGSERTELDDYCLRKYNRIFLNCSFDEQSAARSYLFSMKQEPEEIEQQNQRDSEM